MSDIQDWLDKGQALAGRATEGPWDVDGDATPGPDDHLTLYQQGEGGAIAYVQPSWDDAEFIADARTRLPQALTALQAVLDIHRPSQYGGCIHTACDSGSAWPCPTVEAIQDAIGEDQP